MVTPLPPCLSLPFIEYHLVCRSFFSSTLHQGLSDSERVSLQLLFSGRPDYLTGLEGSNTGDNVTENWKIITDHLNPIIGLFVRGCRTPVYPIPTLVVSQFRYDFTAQILGTSVAVTSLFHLVLFHYDSPYTGQTLLLPWVPCTSTLVTDIVVLGNVWTYKSYLVLVDITHNLVSRDLKQGPHTLSHLKNKDFSRVHHDYNDPGT